MKKINWILGIILLFLGLSACNKNDFERNIGIDDLAFKGAVALTDEAGSAFAYGTHVFTSNPKANPDGLESLNLKNNRWGWASLIEATEGTTPNPINEPYHFYINTQTGVSGVFPASTLVDVVVTADETNLYMTFTPRAGYSFSSTHTDSNYPYTIQINLNSYKYTIFRPHGSTEPFTTEIPFERIPNYTLGDAIAVNISGMIEPDGAGYAYWGATSPIENIGGGLDVVIKPNSLTCLPQSYAMTYAHQVGWGEYLLYRIDDGVYVWNDETNLYLYSRANQYFSYYTTLGLLASTTYPDWLTAGHGATMLSLTVNSGIVTIPLNTIKGYVAGESSSIYFEYSNYGTGSIGYSGTHVREYKLCALTPSTNTTVELPIYMGAVLNDTDKGIQIGIAYIEYDGNELKVKYDLFEEYLMNEVHIYAKDTAPTTIAPGQFGFTEMFNEPVNEFETIFNIEDVEDDGIWLIFYAVIAL